ncbi:cold shock CspA family protein [Nocardia transvalensis]|uniref:Cold shock CspA family protein n=1 Tax=Nocardia transvalensis TaxID=37333 RepID=A0A7W9PKZ1_9NOCA|nr:cold shock domain-containing protein [Nocardia transvalensis]MBB5918065.1 cold shock CspA family protein [Nocardia transvalensis]
MTTTTTTTPTDPAARHAETTRCDPHTHGAELPRWQHGRVAWFDAEKGFGFLTPDIGPAVFVEHRVIEVPGYRTLVAGQPVVFTATDTPRGPDATRVVPYLRTSTSTPPRPCQARGQTGRKRRYRPRCRQQAA